MLQKGAKTILVSHPKRVNYRNDPQDLVSGVSNKEGNVVGIFIHALLDQNPTIIQSITKSLNVSAIELEGIRRANAELLKRIKCEVGISTNIQQQSTVKQKNPSFAVGDCHREWFWKNFLVTGIAGALKKRGFKVGSLRWRRHTECLCQRFI